jgi:hypothetical protein
MAMSEERQGEIALRIFRLEMKRNGIKLNGAQLIRELAQDAPQIEVPFPELAEFAALQIRELANKTFKALEDAALRPKK